MTYHLNGNHPQNLIVANQFNPESFQVVQQVYYSLEHLRVIYRHLPLVQSIYGSLPRIEDITPYVRDIHNISQDLNRLLTLEYNLPFLQDIAPRVEQFVKELECIHTKLNTFDMNFNEVLGLMETNTKHLEDLYCQYEAGLQCLLEQFKQELCAEHQKHMTESQSMYESMKQVSMSVHSAMPLVQQSLEKHNDFTKVLEHLKASDLVILAQFTGSEDDYNKAFKQIKLSEKYGNDETINHHRLEYKLPDNNLFDVLNANRERLTKEGK